MRKRSNEYGMAWTTLSVEVWYDVDAITTTTTTTPTTTIIYYYYCYYCYYHQYYYYNYFNYFSLMLRCKQQNSKTVTKHTQKKTELCIFWCNWYYMNIIIIIIIIIIYIHKHIYIYMHILCKNWKYVKKICYISSSIQKYNKKMIAEELWWTRCV